MVYVRRNLRALSRAEKRRFVDAVLKVKRSGRYDEFVRIHIAQYHADGDEGLRLAHMTPTFFPWHRRFLLDFEQALQRHDPGVSVPYWDWTADRGPGAVIWGEDLLGGNGRRSDRQVTTGAFAYTSGQWRIRHGVTDGQFLTRDFGNPRDAVDLPTRSDVDEAMRDGTYDLPPWDSTSPGGFRNKLEGWTEGFGSSALRNHNRVHRWVGGHMLGGASVNDPAFWLHHSFIDLLWSRWQQAHPKSAYRPARRLGPADLQAGNVLSAHEKMPPWDITPADMESHSRIYRYE
ncbi:tyrosinase family protein [Streptomyces sp. NA04227]|uniref:tyrosinase family protein n=1 Tax=Streptomyces sp. NA04227 TaxID=2742136 RepID=UPI0015906A61|nr:tyrosinase family protein [Streptomyces sp. NA04227]QKW07419.1 tyrosinase family protein [Streptomyces sp. NA04227]